MYVGFATTCSRWFLAIGFFYPEDGSDTFLRNVGSFHRIYTASHPGRTTFCLKKIYIYAFTTSYAFMV
jgi:hypothetical protein